MNDKHFWETDPAHRIPLKLNLGSVSGGDILRIEEELGGGMRWECKRVRDKDKLDLCLFFSFSPSKFFNWLLGFGSSQLACLLHENARS